MSIKHEEISLEELGWDEYREDDKIIRYIKEYVKRNYDTIIDDNTAFIIVMLIDDILTKVDEQK